MPRERNEAELREASRGLKITCPAGEAVTSAAGTVACRCRIAHETIDHAENPRTLFAHCAGESGYMNCTTWREDVESSRELRRALEAEGSADLRRPIRVGPPLGAPAG